MSFTYDESIGAYVGNSGFAVYDNPTPYIANLMRGFTAETDDGVFFSACGVYSKYLIAASAQSGSISMTALSGMINQLLSYKITRTVRSGGKSLTPVFEFKPGSQSSLSFSRLYYTPGTVGDGFVHNATGSHFTAGVTAGMGSLLLTDPNYTPVLSKAAAIINSWPQNDKAKPAIQRAVNWVNERRNCFMGPDQMRAWVFVMGDNVLFSFDNPSARRSHQGIEYPYISIDSGPFGKITLPFWCPANDARNDHLTRETRTTPFVSGTEATAARTAQTTGSSNHFYNAPLHDLSSLDKGSYNLLRKVFGYIMWPELVTEHTRRNGTNHGDFKADLNNLGSVIFNNFELKDDGEITWSHDSAERRRQLDSASSSNSYVKAGVYSGFAPEGINGISQWTMLYGMFSAVGEWKRGVPLESLFISGPRLGFSREEPLIELANALRYDIADTFA